LKTTWPSNEKYFFICFFGNNSFSAVSIQIFLSPNDPAKTQLSLITYFCANMKCTATKPLLLTRFLQWQSFDPLSCIYSHVPQNVLRTGHTQLSEVHNAVCFVFVSYSFSPGMTVSIRTEIVRGFTVSIRFPGEC